MGFLMVSYLVLLDFIHLAISILIDDNLMNFLDFYKYV